MGPDLPGRRMPGTGPEQIAEVAAGLPVPSGLEQGGADRHAGRELPRGSLALLLERLEGFVRPSEIQGALADGLEHEPC